MHLETTEVFWGLCLQELWWFFNYFRITSKYIYEGFIIAKSSATAKFCTNYQINFLRAVMI